MDWSDFLAASLNLFSSISRSFFILLLYTLGIKKAWTKSFIIVSLLLSFLSKTSKGLFILSRLKLAIIVAYLVEALSRVSLKIQSNWVSTVPWCTLRISLYITSSRSLSFSSAYLLPASSISRSLLSFSAMSTIALIFLSCFILKSSFERASKVSEITSPYKLSNTAFFIFSSWFCSKISSYTSGSISLILAIVKSSSIKASLFSLPSYIIF